MIYRTLPTYRRAIATCAFTALIGVICAGLMTAAALVPAPPLVLPLIVAVGVGYPMLAAWGSSPALVVLQQRWSRRRVDERAMCDFRRELDGLPEIGHPLDS